MKTALQTMLGATAAAALNLATGCVAQPTAPNAGAEKFLMVNIQEGTGRTPTATDTVSTHYRGTLLDGREFDSSYKRNEPTEFPVNRVIKGWTEALQLMKEGSKWMLYIPPHLAYGERGAGGLIGPNETLIFEIELLKVK